MTATDGASQAFLKELVHRALQFSIEGGRSQDGKASPALSDFDAALKEIRTFDNRSTRAINGFRAES